MQPVEKVALARECNELYAHQFTIDCALQNNCIPCMYKLFPAGVTDINNSTLVPNCRPEQCPRDYRNKRFESEQKIAEKKLERAHRHASSSSEGVPSTNPWYNGKRVLTVGDGDFSFSLSLLKNHRPSCLVATSYESRASVLGTYKESKATLAELQSLSASHDVHVFHDVDAKALTQCEALARWCEHFDVVVWNFPCVRHPTGADAQLENMDENVEMLRLFFAEVFSFLAPPRRGEGGVLVGGVVHITHKTFEPFCWWELVKIATNVQIPAPHSLINADGDKLSKKKKKHNKEGKEKSHKHKSRRSDQDRDGNEGGGGGMLLSYVHSYSMLFDRCLFPGYINRKALDNKSFPLHDAQTFVFSLRCVPVGAEESSCVPCGWGSACSELSSYERLVHRMDHATVELLEASPNVINTPGLASDADGHSKKRLKIV